MKASDEEVSALKALSPGAVAMTEGGAHFVYLPGLQLLAAGQLRVVDGLLALTNSGYTTRLFLSQPVPERGANWTQQMLFGRTWHTWSWNNVPREQAAIQILREHMEALK